MMTLTVAHRVVQDSLQLHPVDLHVVAGDVDEQLLEGGGARVLPVGLLRLDAIVHLAHANLLVVLPVVVDVCDGQYHNSENKRRVSIDMAQGHAR